MPRSIPEQELAAISGVIAAGERGATAQEIAARLHDPVSHRTLQYRLRYLVTSGRLERDGGGRWVRYRQPLDRSMPEANGSPDADPPDAEFPVGSLDTVDFGNPPGILSPRSVTLLRRLGERRLRQSTGERRRLLDSYRPGRSGYLNRRERARLGGLGALPVFRDDPQPGYGQFGERLELDLVWNTARLSGNGYSELEVRRLVKFGRGAEERGPVDTQSILNHRDALRFLLAPSSSIDLDASTFRNLHAILAHNVIADEAEAGRLRPLGTSNRSAQELGAKACVDSMEDTLARVLETARAIADPLEQALFLMVQVLHVAPFAQLNDRVALYAVNVPLLRARMAPLSFVDWPRPLYADAVRGVGERNRIELLRDLFVWGYERSARRLGMTAKSCAGPNPFRIEHDVELRRAVSEAVRQRVPQRDLLVWLDTRVTAELPPELRRRCIGIAAAELRGLDEGNFARYAVTADEFRAWRAGWLRDCTDIQRVV